MAFFDFIGSKPDQLSLTELLSAIPTVAGDVLQARHGRLGAPIGVGLSDIGQIGQALAQRKQKQAQNLQMFKALQQIDPRVSKVAPIVEQGGTVEQALAALKALTTEPKEGTPEKVSMNGISGLHYPTSGRTEWLAPGETFYQAPQKPAKQGPFDVWRQQHPNDPIENYFKASRPNLSVNVERPLGGIQYDASGKPIGILEVGKDGTPVFKPVPAGVPNRAPRPVAPTTPAQALKNRNEALSNAAKELASSGLFGARTPPGDKVLAKARDDMAAGGLDITGYPLKDGQKVTLSDGRVVTWRNP